jgi:hypothetical protein
MKSEWIDPDKGPTPEQFAAYADGELGGLTDADRAAVEAWLLRDPSALAEIEAQRRFMQAWRDASPPEPTAGTWETVRDRIEAGVAAPARRNGAKSIWRRGLLPIVTVATLGSAAAAAVLTITFSRPVIVPVPPPTAPTADVEPFAVVGPADVVILSVCGADTDCLLVASPPVSHLDDDDLAKGENVRLLNHDFILADVRFQEGEAAMVTPPEGWQKDK